MRLRPCRTLEFRSTGCAADTERFGGSFTSGESIRVSSQRPRSSARGFDLWSHPSSHCLRCRLPRSSAAKASVSSSASVDLHAPRKIARNIPQKQEHKNRNSILENRKNRDREKRGQYIIFEAPACNLADKIYCPCYFLGGGGRSRSSPENAAARGAGRGGD
jgi:hypothetical protein